MRTAKTQYYCAASLDGHRRGDDSLAWLFDYEGSFEGPALAGPVAEGGAYERFYDGVGA